MAVVSRYLRVFTKFGKLSVASETKALLLQRDHTMCYGSWNLSKITYEKACSRWMALKVTQGHQNCLYSISHISLPISRLQ